ncbi:MAG: ATP-binding protein [Gemmatimonas sp.]
MTTVISVPPSLDEHSMELVFEQLAPLPREQKVVIDARHTRWASPYGLTTLLCVAQSRLERADFTVPEHTDTASYWARTGFFRHAADLYELHGHVPRHREGESDVLLEITPIVQSADVHGVVGRIKDKSAEILHGQLGLDMAVTGRFGMTLSEACGNIVEHAGQGGWVAVQTYAYRKRLGRRVVVIAVCDAGVGFRQSLESSPAHRTSDRWDDSRALEAAVLRAVSRYRHGDDGRGQGLAQIRKFVAKWNGKLSVRSGTARLAIVPGWDEDEPMQETLPYFPGSQMQIIIPEKVADNASATLSSRSTAARPAVRAS